MNSMGSSLKQSMSQTDLAGERDKKEVPPMVGTNFGMPPSSAELMRTSHGPVGVFWDYENSPPPAGMPGYVVVENIRNVVHHFGQVTLFKAYLEITEDSKKNLRSELQSSGVSLTDVPHNGRKDAADKMLMVDMLAFAIDTPAPATIVLISGDKDFVYALGLLRNRKYNIVLVVPEWRYDVLNQDIWNQQQQQVLQSSASDSSISPASVSSHIPLLSSGNNSRATSTATSTEPSPGRLILETSPVSDQTRKLLKVSINADTHTRVESAEEYEGFCFSPKAPGYFDLLVEVLEKFRAAGEPQPRRSKVGNELSRRNPLLYHRAACSSFKEYCEMAVKEGIVDIGGDKGLAWVSLKESYRGKLF